MLAKNDMTPESFFLTFGGHVKSKMGQPLSLF